MSDSVFDYIKKLISYFNDNDINYVVVGGIAVMFTGRTRATQDIDFIIEHKKLDKPDFISYLQENDFDATLIDLDGFEEKSHCTFYIKGSSMRIDIKGVYSSQEQESIDMALDFEVDDFKIRIDHPLNTILYKIQYDSDIDYEDAISVYVRYKDSIDMDFLFTKAKEMNIYDDLTEFIKEIEGFLKEIFTLEN